MSTSSRVEEITPKKARQMLERNKNNRPLRENYVIELAQAICDGEWQLNGETIKVDDVEDIKDGQHRLNAVLLANKPIQSYVVRGLPPECFDTIDRGHGRTVGDILHRHGHTHCNVLGAALSWLWRMENKVFEKGVGVSGRNKPRAAQSLATLDHHKGVIESVQKTAHVTRLMSPGLAACCHYLFHKKSAALADSFFESVATGEGLRKTQAAYKFREFLIANRTAKRKANQVEVAALAIKAWSHARNGDNVQQLRWRSGGENPEAFPKIV